MKIAKIITIFVFFIAITLPQVKAYEQENADISSVINALPKEVREYLPKEMTEQSNAVEFANNTEIDQIYLIIFGVLKKSMPKTVKKFCSLLSLIILISIINSAKNSLSSETFSSAITLVTTVCTACFTYDAFSDIRQYVELYTQGLNSAINALLPIMTALYTMGGNVSTAVLNASGVSVLLTAVNTSIQYIMLPLVNICFGLSVCSVTTNQKGLLYVTANAKKFFAFILSGTVTLLSIFLIFKTNIASAADGVAARTIKFAGSFIPIIGSALGESVRSLMAGVGLIKSSVGFVGIVIIIVTTLPILLNITANKLCIDITRGLAEMLNCEKESMLLGEFSSILGFILAVIVCISIVFILELTVFASISPALGVS